jgi:ribosome biogenesis protein MAK21
MDTLFRITHSSNFNTSIQALMLIEQLSTAKNLSVDRFYRTLYESLLDPRLINSSKHALYLNLLFRALKSDLNIRRVKAFAKRMIQIIHLHQPPFVCGIIYLLRELEGLFPGLKTLLNDPEVVDQEEEEVFRDVPEDGPSIMEAQAEETIGYNSQSYDGRKRDPEHSNADKSCLWEIVSTFQETDFEPLLIRSQLPFLSHFHPSVSMFADRLLCDNKMPPKPDLTSHTLTHFLDRFVYRNAKSKSESQARGGSIMQPLSGSESKGILISNRSASSAQQPVNSEAFWRKKPEDVAEDEVFFHKYFSQIGKSKQSASDKKKEKKAKKGSDDEGEEDEDEDEIWQALVDSRPEVEGGSDDELDDEMLDLDDSESGSNDENMDSDGGVELNFDDSEDEIASAPEEGEEERLFESEDELFEKEMQQGEDDKSQGKKVETSREKRKKMKSLPTFASVEDYAEMLDNDEDEDL